MTALINVHEAKKERLKIIKEVGEDELISQWIGEGFIRQAGPSETHQIPTSSLSASFFFFFCSPIAFVF